MYRSTATKYIGIGRFVKLKKVSDVVAYFYLWKLASPYALAVCRPTTHIAFTQWQHTRGDFFIVYGIMIVIYLAVVGLVALYCMLIMQQPMLGHPTSFRTHLLCCLYISCMYLLHLAGNLIWQLENSTLVYLIMQ